jgi:hypothetical protein
MNPTEMAESRGQGMNATLKYTILPLVLIVAVVFAVTLISLGVGSGSGGEDEAAQYLPPLFFTTDRMLYDPSSEDISKRTFPGYFEVSDRQVPVSFWFRNPHPVPVRVSFLGSSCTSCSAARVAVVPPEAIRALNLHGAVGGGPVGPAEPHDLLPRLADALTATLSWTNFNIMRPDGTDAVVPPGSEETPTWGVLQFGVKVSSVGPKRLDVAVGLIAGDNALVPMPFHMVLYGVNPFSVQPASLQFGELPEGSNPVTKEMIYWSSTRGAEDGQPLPEPKFTPSSGDPFLKVGNPDLLGPVELERLAMQLAGKGEGGPVRVRGAYRVPVTVYRRLPEPQPGAPAEPDIGPYERQIGVSAAGTLHTVTVPVTATMTGLVSLLDAKVADLGDFSGVYGHQKAFTLVSDRTDLELRPLPDESRPGVLQPSLSTPQSFSGRRQWTLTVAVPPRGWLSPLPTDSVVVLEARTADGVRKVRIPVKGTASARGR